MLFLLPMMQAQSSVGMMQYHHVSPENRAEFIHRETTYWAEIAKAAIKEGKMTNWALWEKVGGINVDDSPNFFFYNAFTKVEDLNNLNEVWDPTKVFPEGRIQDMDTRGLSTLKHQIVVAGNGAAGNGKAFQFLRVNYAKASDMERYLELERTVWQPFIKGQMDSGNCTQSYWGSAAIIMPAGDSVPYNALSVDGYNTLSEAIMPSTSYKTTPTIPDFTELDKVHTKKHIQVYRLVKAVN